MQKRNHTFPKGINLLLGLAHPGQSCHFMEETRSGQALAGFAKDRGKGSKSVAERKLPNPCLFPVGSAAAHYGIYCMCTLYGIYLYLLPSFSFPWNVCVCLSVCVRSKLFGLYCICSIASSLSSRHTTLEREKKMKRSKGRGDEQKGGGSE